MPNMSVIPCIFAMDDVLQYFKELLNHHIALPLTAAPCALPVSPVMPIE
jgi:hypothetical protein